MHEIIKAGLERMRDPNTCKTELVERRVLPDEKECFCAMGCICKESIDRGIGHWEESDRGNFFLVMRGSSYDAIAAYSDWYAELERHISVGKILILNDNSNLPLSAIADRIEAAYKEKEASV